MIAQPFSLRLCSHDFFLSFFSPWRSFPLHVYAVSIDGLLIERQTRDRKVSSSNPGRSGGSIFFSRVNFVCLLLFGVRSTPVLPRWHVKDPGHSAESACDRLHLNMHTSLTQRSRSGLAMPLCRHSVGNLPGNEPTLNSQGNTRSQSSELA